MESFDLSSLGPAGAAVIVVLLFLRYITGKDKSQENRDAVFIKALNDLTQSNKQVALATRKAAKEAKERNGHLAELAIENQKVNADVLNQIAHAVTVKDQKVEH